MQLLLSLMVLTLTFSQSLQLLDAQPLKSPSSSHSMRITTDIAGLLVLKEGVIAARLGPGQTKEIEANIPITYLTLQAPGRVQRNLRIRFSGEDNQTIVLTLPKAPQGYQPLSEDELPAAESFIPIRRIPSLCRRPLQGNFKQVQIPTCAWNSMHDDLTYAGFPLHLQDMTKISNHHRLQVRHILYGTGNAPAYWQQITERMHASSTSTLILEMNAVGNLLNQDCRRALELVREGDARKLKSPTLFLVRAACREAQQNLKFANRAYKNAIRVAGKKPSGSAPSYFHLARVLMPKEPGLALRALKKCSEVHPHYMPCRFARHFIYSTSGEPQKAEKEWEMARVKLENHMQPRFRRVIRIHNQGAAAELATRAHRLAVLNPASFEFTWLRGYSQLRLGQKDEAARSFRDTKYLTPIALSQLKTTFELVDGLEDFSWQENFYTRIASVFPKKVFVWWKLARLYANSGKCQQVIDLNERNLKHFKDSEKAAVMDLVGRCYLNLSNYREASNAFLSLAIARPKDWRPFFNAADALEKLGDLRQAATYFRKALERDPPADFVKAAQRRLSRIRQ